MKVGSIDAHRNFRQTNPAEALVQPQMQPQNPNRYRQPKKVLKKQKQKKKKQNASKKAPPQNQGYFRRVKWVKNPCLRTALIWLAALFILLGIGSIATIIAADVTNVTPENVGADFAAVCYHVATTLVATSGFTLIIVCMCCLLSAPPRKDSYCCGCTAISFSIIQFISATVVSVAVISMSLVFQFMFDLSDPFYAEWLSPNTATAMSIALSLVSFIIAIASFFIMIFTISYHCCTKKKVIYHRPLQQVFNEMHDKDSEFKKAQAEKRKKEKRWQERRKRRERLLRERRLFRSRKSLYQQNRLVSRQQAYYAGDSPPPPANWENPPPIKQEWSPSVQRKPGLGNNYSVGGLRRGPRQHLKPSGSMPFVMDHYSYPLIPRMSSSLSSTSTRRSQSIFTLENQPSYVAPLSRGVQLSSVSTEDASFDIENSNVTHSGSPGFGSVDQVKDHWRSEQINLRQLPTALLPSQFVNCSTGETAESMKTTTPYQEHATTTVDYQSTLQPHSEFCNLYLGEHEPEVSIKETCYHVSPNVQNSYPNLEQEAPSSNVRSNSSLSLNRTRTSLYGRARSQQTSD